MNDENSAATPQPPARGGRTYLPVHELPPDHPLRKLVATKTSAPQKERKPGKKVPKKALSGTKRAGALPKKVLAILLCLGVFFLILWWSGYFKVK